MNICRVVELINEDEVVEYRYICVEENEDLFVELLSMALFGPKKRILTEDINDICGSITHRNEYLWNFLYYPDLYMLFSRTPLLHIFKSRIVPPGIGIRTH
jgi:hypothetical protein